MKNETFNPKERAAEKQRRREDDARRLASGEVSREQLSVENSFFKFTGPLKIVHSGGPPLKQRK